MSHLLDTNICSAHFRRPGGLAHRFIQYGGACSFPPSFWVSSMPGHITSAIQILCSRKSPTCSTMFRCWISIMTVRNSSARTVAACFKQGISVPTADLMIAAVALVHNLTLVTNNTADFRNIPGLRLEDWLTP